MEKVLVSACLIGRECRYDGGAQLREDLVARLAREGREAVPFCPEEAGGLGTPRPPARFVGGRVVTESGRDVTAAFERGGRLAVAKARDDGCRTAYLKERSPSCGCAQVHTDAGVVPGCGVTTALLRQAGITTVPVE